MVLEDNIKIVNVDLAYIARLHEACSEVYYKPQNYDRKPYIGILLTTDGNKYVIPLTSAKDKHRNWKNTYFDRMLIYEYVPRSRIGKLSARAVYVDLPDEDRVKYIMSVIDIKKMIPIRDDLYTVVNINHDPSDSEELRQYKDLLNKEYRFCISAKDDIVRKASAIYDRQMSTGKVVMFGCDFKVLEDVCSEYEVDEV